MSEKASDSIEEEENETGEPESVEDVAAEDDVQEVEAASEDDSQALDMASALAAADHDEPDVDEGFSLEELSQSYQTLVENSESHQDAPSEASSAANEEAEDAENSQEEESPNEIPVTPVAIIEALLFVGKPDSSEISGKDIAKLMRGVDESEVHRCVQALNDDYARQRRAIRIVEHGAGYRVDLAPEVEAVRENFYGRARDIQLNQAAIDCLALVAYQPGSSREDIEQQRGQPSGGVLNQLVRRQLLEMKREGKGKSAVSRYFPTERLLQLSGLDSLDDLPQVEEWES